MLRVDDKGFTKIYSCNVSEECDPVHFHKDGRRVYMVTNKGDNVDLIKLVLFDLETGKEELVESDPMNRVDLGGPIFSDLSNELVAALVSGGRHRWEYVAAVVSGRPHRREKRLRRAGGSLGFELSDLGLNLFLADLALALAY